MLEVCVAPTCVSGLGAHAVTDRQDEKLEVAENNWVRRMCGGGGGIKKREKHMRIKVVGSREGWPGHIQKTIEEILTKRTKKTEECCRKRRGRPK